MRQINSISIKLFEIARYVLVAIGFYLAYLPNQTLTDSTRLLVLWVVVPIAGLTAIESLFFKDLTAVAKGRETGSAYQVQSGLNNLAIALTGLVVVALDWGLKANQTILIVLLIFLCLSAMNHTFEFFYSKHRQIIHLLRPLFSMVLVCACIPFLVS